MEPYSLDGGREPFHFGERSWCSYRDGLEEARDGCCWKTGVLESLWYLRGDGLGQSIAQNDRVDSSADGRDARA